MVLFLKLLVGIGLGFFLPGFLLARKLKLELIPVMSFVFSVVILYQVIFWLGLAGVPLSWPNVITALLVLTAVFLVWTRGGESATREETKYELSSIAKLLIVAATIVFAIRTTLWPITGWDVYWRWEYMAIQMLTHETFWFYPAFSAESFAFYPYPDGYPPLVSFCYFWLYASVGEPYAPITGIFVTVTWASTCALVWAITKRLCPEGRAADYSLTLLLGSQLFFWAIAIGQECATICLGIVGMLYFLVVMDNERPCASSLAASCCAALCVLSRDYGLFVCAIGVVAMLWRKMPLSRVVAFLAVSLALTLPWHIRTWAITGNPLYSLNVAGIFPVNAAYMIELAELAETRSFGTNTAFKIIGFLLAFAKYSWAAGIGVVASVFLLRRYGYLFVGAVLTTMIWAMSVRYTASPTASERVMAPAFALFAILAGIWLAERQQLRRMGMLATVLPLAVLPIVITLLDTGTLPATAWKGGLVAVLAIAGIGALLDAKLEPTKAAVVLHLVLAVTVLRTGIYMTVFPERRMPRSVAAWVDSATNMFTGFDFNEAKIKDYLLSRQSAKGYRIVAQSQFMARLFNGTPYEMVPFFSPEMDFLRDGSISGQAVDERLKALNVRAVLLQDRSTSLKHYPHLQRVKAEWPLAIKRFPGRLYLHPEMKSPWDELD